MVFNDYGKVIIAWYLFSSDGAASNAYDLEDGTEYEGKLRIAQFDTEANLEYYRE